MQALARVKLLQQRRDVLKVIYIDNTDEVR